MQVQCSGRRTGCVIACYTYVRLELHESAVVGPYATTADHQRPTAATTKRENFPTMTVRCPRLDVRRANEWIMSICSVEIRP